MGICKWQMRPASSSGKVRDPEHGADRWSRGLADLCRVDPPEVFLNLGRLNTWDIQ